MNDSEHLYKFKVSCAYKADNINGCIILGGDNENLLVDCGAITHIVNTEERYVETEDSFRSDLHFIELADGSNSNNLSKKRGTVQIPLHYVDGNIAQVRLENALYVL